jgi:carboxypeptidase T
MKDKKALIAIVFFIFIISLLQAEDLLIRVPSPEMGIKNWLNSQKLEDRITYDREALEIIANTEILKYLADNQINYEVLKTESEIIRDLENYRSYDETYTELQDFSETYPEITSLFSLGPSTGHQYFLDGNDNYTDFQNEIWCLKVSDNPELEEDEPNVFFGSLIHAREAITLEVVMTFMEELFAGYGSEPELTEFITGNQIWFVPIINPDGYMLVHEELNIWKRKNIRDNNENGLPDYSTIDGVDLNRNFGYVWDPNGPGPYPDSQTFNGPEEWSELEIQYLRNLMQARKFWAGITYHSQGEWVLYPLGMMPGVCSYDHEIMGDLAAEMAMTIPRIDSPGYYTPLQIVDYGSCYGNMSDWTYAEERVFGYAIELANAHIPSDPVPICEDNMAAFRVMLHRLDNRLLTGHVTDPWGNSLVAEINVVQIDEQDNMTVVEPYRSGAHYGRYFRPLLAGEYDVDFICYGYETESVSGVQIDENGVTTLDIILHPAVSGEHSMGDVDDNGSIDAFDASLLMRYIVGWDTAPYAPLPWAFWRLGVSDTNQDEELNSYDCALILQYLVGLINEF